MTVSHSSQMLLKSDKCIPMSYVSLETFPKFANIEPPMSSQIYASPVAKSAILSEKQTRQESRLMWVDFNLKKKWCVLMSFRSGNKTPSDVHSCLLQAQVETLFHTKNNLFCLVCRRGVSFLFAPRCIFANGQLCCLIFSWKP